MMENLTFQIYSPLVSWGTPAVGQERPSALAPTHSAIAGLLCHSLGINRVDRVGVTRVAGQFKLAVFGTPGFLLVDYHTVQATGKFPKRGRKPHTRREELERGGKNIESWREYWQDSAWLAVLFAVDGADLSEWAAAIREPRHTPFFGRKSCTPSLPLAPRISSGATVREAVESYPADPVIERLWQRGRLWVEHDTGCPPIGYTPNFEGSEFTEPRLDVPSPAPIPRGFTERSVVRFEI